MTDPTMDSLRLSWTVPEGHFDSFVVQFKDKSGPRVVPVKGQERTATITALDAGRKYRFLLYGLLGKKRFGPLTAEGITGEGFRQVKGQEAIAEATTSPFPALPLKVIATTSCAMSCLCLHLRAHECCGPHWRKASHKTSTRRGTVGD